MGWSRPGVADIRRETPDPGAEARERAVRRDRAVRAAVGQGLPGPDAAVAGLPDAGGRRIAVTRAGVRVAVRTVYAPGVWPLRIAAYDAGGGRRRGRRRGWRPCRTSRGRPASRATRSP